MNSNNKGLIIINLGSPESYLVRDVRKYLKEFLMDERVIDIPSLLRQILVKGIIVPSRSGKSAKAYQSIWTSKGSPLKVITEEFANIIESKIEIPVSVAMRYGNPTPADALKDLKNKAEKLDQVLIAPMYPHYAMSSYETAVAHVKNQILSLLKNCKIHVLKPFYNEPAYISSLAANMKSYLAKYDFDAFLFSYHGLPIRHLQKSDTTKNHCYMNDDCCEIISAAWQTCYKHQVKTTTQLVSEKLNLDAKKVMISFQSRLGSDKWIQPFTDKLLAELPKQGVKKLLVSCPAFVADCLETQEEIDLRGRKIFLKNGGEIFERVNCLNTSDEWTETFSSYCKNSETTYKDWWN
ncbi:MAG: ferrochelatase [Chitinophagales bacterium]|nr:ferrochelatase [Chitinophagales bacterium]